VAAHAHTQPARPAGGDGYTDGVDVAVGVTIGGRGRPCRGRAA
jgi:hypothetical protein